MQNKNRQESCQIPDRVLDGEGYIIDQGHMDQVPFGWFSTKEKGCGWIAAYNLLKMNGMEEPADQVRREMEHYGLPGKVLGQELVWLLAYLHHKGFHIRVSMPGYRGCEKILQDYPTGILMYLHKRGAHYAAYHAVDAQKVHLYNAIYQRKNHIVPIRNFLKAHAVLHGAVMIGCRPRYRTLA